MLGYSEGISDLPKTHQECLLKLLSPPQYFGSITDFFFSYLRLLTEKYFKSTCQNNNVHI